MAPKDYDTTIARMAGNIAAGLVTKPDLNGSGHYGVGGLAEWIQSVTLMSVGMARAIVAEVKRTAVEERKDNG